MDLRLLKSVAKFVWRCSLGISILVMAFFCLDLAISFIFNGKQGTNENLADRMIEPYMLNALPPSGYHKAQKQPEINTLSKYENNWVFEPPRVSRRPNFLREYPNEKYLFT